MKRLLIPLVLLVIGKASSAQSNKKEPPPPPPPPKAEIVKYQPPVVIKKELPDDFYHRNPSVEKITSSGHVITLRMKNGTIEKYDMGKPGEDKLFNEKYGRSPIPPPPPPPKKLS